MSEQVKWHTKPCSVHGHCLLIGPSTGRHELSLQMPIETAEYIVRACNAHKSLTRQRDELLEACEELMELADDGSASFDDPEPGGTYDKAQAAIAKAGE